MAATATVSDILSERLHTGEPPIALMPVLSILAHGAFLVGLYFISKPKPMAPLPKSTIVSIVSMAKLGRTTTAPKPAEAPKASKPVIEKPPVKAEPVSKTAMALPEKKPAKDKPKEVPRAEAKPSAKTTDPSQPASKQPPGPPDIEMPQGSANGLAGGTALFGASVSAFDADFPFRYYIEQLQSLIATNWQKPDAPDETACTVYFKILRSGQVTDVKVEAPSSLAYYDRAASRAVFAANPLPPLPPEFKGETLGVHLRFQ